MFFDVWVSSVKVRKMTEERSRQGEGRRDGFGERKRSGERGGGESELK